MTKYDSNAPMKKSRRRRFLYSPGRPPGCCGAEVVPMADGGKDAMKSRWTTTGGRTRDGRGEERTTGEARPRWGGRKRRGSRANSFHPFVRQPPFIVAFSLPPRRSPPDLLTAPSN